jgi:hypothetical protein
MDQIKTFVNPSDKEINDWLKENPFFEIKSIIKTPMHDFQGYGSPSILNQWTDVIVVYVQHGRPPRRSD